MKRSPIKRKPAKRKKNSKSLKARKNLLKRLADTHCVSIVTRMRWRCEVCEDPRPLQVHHFIPRSQSARLRWYIPNLVLLCRGCHYEHHTKSNPIIHATIIQQRGFDWWNDLKEKRKELVKTSLAYYEAEVERLEGLLQGESE